MELVFDPNAVLPPVRHSRTLLAGIQAESGLDPRLRHSGVTLLESHLSAAAAIFEGDREEHEVRLTFFHNLLNVTGFFQSVDERRVD